MTTTTSTYSATTFFTHASSVAETYGIQPVGFQVLVAIWRRPEGTKSAGGILLTSKTLDEDEFQGKVAMTVSLGPAAYVPDPYRTFQGGAYTEPGGWVVIPKSEHISTMFRIDGVTFAFIADDRFIGTVRTPVAV